jgi:hypothetical protein
MVTFSLLAVLALSRSVLATSLDLGSAEACSTISAKYPGRIYKIGSTQYQSETKGELATHK